MLIYALSASVFVVLFYILAIENTFHRPHIYKFIPKLKAVKVSLFSATVFENGKNYLVILPNVCFRFILDKVNLDFDFGRQTNSICNLNSASFVANGFQFFVNKTTISIKGHGSLCFSCARPNVQFYYKSKEKNLVLKTELDYNIKFKNFSHLSVLGDVSRLNFNAEINGNAEIDFADFDLKAKAKSRADTLRNLFGFYDSKKWRSLPNFDVTNSPTQSLAYQYLKKSLSANQKSYYLPNYKLGFISLKDDKFIIKGNVCLNLDKLGLSKIVKLSKFCNSVVIKDLLVNFKVKIEVGVPFTYQQFSMFGTSYLILKTKEKGNANLSFLNDLLTDIDLSCKLIFGTNIKAIPNTSLYCVLLNVNRLVLHGVFVDVFKIFKSLRVRFLNESVRFCLANLLLSFIHVFKRFDLLCLKEIKNLFYEFTNISLKEISPSHYIFLKKVLPFISHEKTYNLVFDCILTNKDRLKSCEYEFILYEIYGIHLAGSKLYISPKRDAQFKISAYLGGHKVNINKLEKGKNIKIDNIYLSGIDFIDLNFYPPEINIEFTE